MKLVLQHQINQVKLVTIDSNYIKKHIGELVKDTDLSKFIL